MAVSPKCPAERLKHLNNIQSKEREEPQETPTLPRFSSKEGQLETASVQPAFSHRVGEWLGGSHDPINKGTSFSSRILKKDRINTKEDKKMKTKKNKK